MSFWQNLRDQLLNLWNRWTLSQRIGFSAATVACVAAVVGTMIWATQPEYVVIARNREPGQIFDIAGILDTEKIPYTINVSSTAISVPTSQVNDAHLALKDMLHPEEVAQAKSSGFPMFQSPRAEEDQRLRDLEARVQNALKDVKAIESAKVSISSPEKSPFADQNSPVTASVIIRPASGVQMTNMIANSVINVVARSVPDLKPENVVVTDSEGRQYDLQKGMNSAVEENLKIRRDIERELKEKAETVLGRIEGVRSVVTVTATMDHDKKTQRRLLIDDEKKAVIGSTTKTSQYKGIAPQPQGPAGVTGNTAPGTPTSSASGDTKDTESEEEYLPSQTEETLTSAGGSILRLSVAAVVDLSGMAAGNTLDETDIEDLIRSAIGSTSSGKDEIQVVLAKVAPTDNVAVPTAAPIGLEQWIPLAQYISLGLGALVAFVMGLLMIKRMKPIVIKETVGPGIPLADARRLASVSEQAKAHPELVANILSAWLNEQEAEAASDKNPPPTAPVKDTPRGSRGASVPKSATTSPAASSQERKAA
ncbi:MAG: flagellar basal-body MS-ring/collar protein FliF [Planctomycetaceae bacterium]